MEIRPHNPKLLLLDSNGNPVPFAHILFYEEGTDVPASVFVEETSAETTFVIADDSGFFPSVILHPRKYTLRSFVPMEGVENPSFPDDFVAYETWNLDGGDAPKEGVAEVAFVSSLADLRDVDTAEYSAADVNGVRYALFDNLGGFPDDGGFAILPNDGSGKIWIAVLEGGLLPVTLFGADTSGQTSSSSAIASAFACVSYYAQTPRSPVPMPTAVYFPYGNYAIVEDISATAPVVVAEFARITNNAGHSLDFVIWDKYLFEGTSPSVFAGDPVVLKYNTRTPHFVDGYLDGGVGAVDAANVGPNAEVLAASISLQSAASVSIPRVIVPAAGLAIDKAGAASLYIGAVDFTSGGKLDLNGVTGRIEIGCEIRTSQLANAARDWTKLKGPRLVVDEAVSLIANASLYFDEVFVAIANGVKNETGAPLFFVNAGTMSGKSGSIAIQNVIVGRVSPVAVNWTGCGSAEFSAFVSAHGADADFENVAITANVSLSYDATLRRLNLTGDLTINNASVELDECAISGNVSAWTARIFDSSIGGSLYNAVDVEAVGSRFNIIAPRIGEVTDPTPRQGISFKFYRCNIADSVHWATTHPLRNLVIRECSVDNARFFKKLVGAVWTKTNAPAVEAWDTAERVNIDISDNTTCDTSNDALLRSKGFITLDGTEQDGTLYLTRLGTKGIIDFLNAAGTESRIGDTIFRSFAVGNIDSAGPSAIPYSPQFQKDSGGYAAAVRRSSANTIAFIDPWSTNKNW
jgi:hypothetical protein